MYLLKNTKKKNKRMITKTKSSIDFTLNFNKHIEKINTTKKYDNLRMNPNLTPRKIKKLNLVESENNISNLTFNKTNSKNDLEICSLEYSRLSFLYFKC